MIYRDAEDAHRQRREELLRERRGQLEGLPLAALAVYTRRQGRIAAGWAGIAVAACLMIGAITRFHGLTTILWLGWPAMIAAYLGGSTVAQFVLRWKLTGAFGANSYDSLAEEVARLEEQTPATWLRDRCARLEAPSLSRPMIAVSFLTPLSLHYLAGSAMRAHFLTSDEFDSWIGMSLILVGHAHLVLAYHANRFARIVARGTSPSLLALVSRSTWRAFGATVTSAALPGILGWIFLPFIGITGEAPFMAIALLIVAPALVAATGAVFIPPMFAAFSRRLRRERVILAVAGRTELRANGVAAPAENGVDSPHLDLRLP